MIGSIMTVSNITLAGFLRDIPQSNQRALPLSQICGDCETEVDYATLLGFARLLETFGIVQIFAKHPPAQTLIQATSQTAKYTLASFADYVERGEPIITDWKTRGLQDHPLANGASFLYALEQHRVTRFDNCPPSRYVKVAQVLIKRITPETGQHELLFQFDKNANQYQLIGGRSSEGDGDDMMATIVREIEEELPLNDLYYPDTYQLTTIASDLSINGSISPTFGALTNYTFWIYHLTGLNHPLKLEAGDYWVPVEMVLEGIVTDTTASYPFSSPEIYQRIHTLLPNGLMGLSSSFTTASIHE